MTARAALPFLFKRSTQVIGAASLTTTDEVVHGLLRLEDEALIIQWRLARTTEHVGTSIRTDTEVEAVEETRVPLDGVAGASVRRGWLQWFTGPRIVLNASDLRAFEAMAGERGLKLDHPAEMVLTVRRSDVLLAEEFCAELALALAHRSVAAGEGRPPLDEPREGKVLPGQAVPGKAVPSPSEAEPAGRRRDRTGA